MAKLKTILVVDADPDILDATRAILEAAGYAVETASNGTEGLAKVESTKPDLVVLDVMMDKETEGFHVSYKMRADEDTRRIPIMALTAIGAKSGFEFSQETDGDYLPVDAYMEKPLEPEEFLGKVAELLDKDA